MKGKTGRSIRLVVEKTTGRFVLPLAGMPNQRLSELLTPQYVSQMMVPELLLLMMNL